MLIKDNNDLNLNVKYNFTEKSGKWPKLINGIYGIFSKSTGKCYVGMTRDMEGFLGRWENHRAGLRHRKHDNSYLQRSYNKRGDEDFYFMVLEILKKEDYLMPEREGFWINKLNSNYDKFGWNLDDYDENYKTRYAHRPASIKQRKDFQLINPNGDIVNCSGIAAFARENGLNRVCLARLLNGNIHCHKGYKSINPEFHYKPIDRSKVIHDKYRKILPVFITFGISWGNFSFCFQVNGIRYKGRDNNIFECINKCERKLIELQCQEKLEKLRKSCLKKDLNKIRVLKIAKEQFELTLSNQ